MPREINGLGSPEDWLKRAKSNLAIASQQKTEEIFWEDFCFEAQQPAEKALKAVLLSKSIKFRFVHDIAELITILEQNGISFPDEIRAAATGRRRGALYEKGMKHNACLYGQLLF